MYKKLAVLSAALLLAALAYLYLQNTSLENKLSALREEQRQSLEDISRLSSSLHSLNASYGQLSLSLEQRNRELSEANANISALRWQLSEKERQLSETSSSLEAQKQKAAAIASELYSLERSINDSFSWFKSNAALPSDYGWKADIFKRRVLEDCVDGTELNLGCISYIMENTAFSIHYRTDIVAGKDDHLQSVRETINLGWGDCEDYSLIFKATLNTVKESTGGLEAVAFAPGGSANFRIYPKESTPVSETERYWYVPNAKKTRLGSMDSSHFYVICYRSGPSTGHCTVAISPNEITSSEDVPLLSGAKAFEPQNGQYLGTVGNGGQYSICSDPSCTRTLNAISLVIADSELFKYENGKWVGYSDYYSQVKGAQASLSSG